MELAPVGSWVSMHTGENGAQGGSRGTTRTPSQLPPTPNQLPVLPRLRIPSLDLVFQVQVPLRSMEGQSRWRWPLGAPVGRGCVG